jgi:membrane-bound ClpP family serine protease
LTPIVLSLLFLLAALGLLIADLFLPTGGIALVMSLICAGASVLFGFRHSYDFGIWLLIGELASVPFFAWVFLKYWPQTPLGRKMIIEPIVSEGFTWEAESLIGREGISGCEMVPTGKVEIDGRRWDATSRAGLIAEGVRVKVIDEEMGQLYVVPVIELPSESPEPAEEKKKESVFDRPAKELGIDSLE